MPSKYPETTQKIFTTNGFSSEKNSDDGKEMVRRKSRFQQSIPVDGVWFLEE